MAHFSEPEISPDDTQPRPPVPSAPSAPVSAPSAAPNWAIQEPAVAPDDTHPRPAVDPADAAAFAGISESARDVGDEKGGCGSPLLIGAVILSVLCLFATSVGLAGFAGYRDGYAINQTQKASTLVVYLVNQATLARGDCDAGRYELCQERCKYVATQQPYYPGMDACMSQAQIALSATPTPTQTATPVQPTMTPTQIPPTSNGQFTPEELLARGKSAFRNNDYENAMKWLEDLRGLDASYDQTEVVSMLVTTYEALAGQYQYNGQLSQMIIVVKKAEILDSLADTNWPFTANAAELYLSAKGYLDASNYKDADTVFNRLMTIAPTYLDTKVQACKAFAGAGDTSALKTYGC